MGDDETLLADVRGRTDDAILHADLILLVLEYDKITDFDEYIVKKLRRSKKPVIIIANKADNPKRDMEAYNLLSLGLGDVVPMSAVQNRGFFDIKTKIATELKAQGHTFVQNTSTEDGLLKLAIIGRPNVGKSSLINALSGSIRSIVKDMPGTTRDAIDTIIEFKGQEICLIDTAGIRRAGKI